MKLKSSFQITSWDAEPVDESTEAVDLSKAVIRKSFSGELEGTSIGYGVFCKAAAETGGYIVVEVVTGATEDGREGSFVIQHYGIRDTNQGGPWHGDVVPGTGTDGFAGVTGKFKIEHGDEGAFFIFDLEFE